MKARPVLERIEEKIDRRDGSSGCHHWLGRFGGNGTAQLPIKVGKKKTSITVRRFWWERHYGAIPADRMVTMTCGNRACMNERHMTLSPRKDPVTRFWAKVQKTAGCWIWTGYRNKRGYGQFMPTWTTVVQTHRYAWELVNGPIPPDAPPCLCHRCDNPACCNPGHLFLGTFKDNMQDMFAKGRAASQKNPEGVRAALAKGRAVAAENKRALRHKRPTQATPGNVTPEGKEQ